MSRSIYQRPQRRIDIASSTGSWDLDATGNWSSVTTDGTTEDRTYNQQNEFVDDGADPLEYDANGDLVQGGGFDGFTYDAWNQLVRFSVGSSDLDDYVYDALGRRVT